MQSNSQSNSRSNSLKRNPPPASTNARGIPSANNYSYISSSGVIMPQPEVPSDISLMVMNNEYSLARPSNSRSQGKRLSSTSGLPKYSEKQIIEAYTTSNLFQQDPPTLKPNVQKKLIKFNGPSSKKHKRQTSSQGTNSASQQSYNQSFENQPFKTEIVTA